MNQNSVPLIGAHVSIAGGIFTGPARAAAIGCNFMQFFSDSPRVWQRREVSDETIAKFLSEQTKHKILGNVIHSLYLINLASENPDLIEKSLRSVLFDMQLASRVSSVGVVVHVGSYGKRTWKDVREQVVKNIAHCIDQSPSEAVFLIENAAGQSGKIGSNFSEIRYLIDELKAPTRVGWCLDTCHAFAAGFSLVPMVHEQNIFDAMAEFDLEEYLKVVHVNDSRDEFFSHRDRHANIGDGTIGTDTLATFLRNTTLKGLPLVLEVPGIEDKGPDAENIRRLHALVS